MSPMTPYKYLPFINHFLSYAEEYNFPLIYCSNTLEGVKVIRQFSLTVVFKQLTPYGNTVMNKERINIFVKKLSSFATDTSIRVEKLKTNTKNQKTEAVNRSDRVAPKYI
jgi:hypothetical protein